jgi:hypothetical protein
MPPYCLSHPFNEASFCGTLAGVSPLYYSVRALLNNNNEHPTKTGGATVRVSESSVRDAQEQNPVSVPSLTNAKLPTEV